MSFHIRSEDIRIDDGHILRARLRRGDGGLSDAEIDLDRYLGNDDGRFMWEGINFSGSAENAEFHIEGGGEVPVLRALLKDNAGNLQQADVNLAERIENSNGSFEFK